MVVAALDHNLDLEQAVADYEVTAAATAYLDVMGLPPRASTGAP